MCGIFGYIGSKNATTECLKGLRQLEYRGYDSAGIAGISKNTLFVRKKEGRLLNLEESLNQDPLILDVAISHTRWATHGEASERNAHPHFDSNKTVALVHNGIIENHYELRAFLKSVNYTFYSETDTEIIAALIAHFYSGDPLKAIEKTIEKLHGFWGLAIIHKEHPGKIFAVSRQNPIAIAYVKEEKECYISSDANAFPEGLDVLFLKNNEKAILSIEGALVFDEKGARVLRPFKKLDKSQTAGELGPYKHFMHKEIFEQPQTVRQALSGRVDENNGSVVFEGLNLSEKELKEINRVVILGCGTSHHASLIAAALIEEKALIPAVAEIASEFRYRKPVIDDKTLVIAVSQSGETLDTISAFMEAEKKGAKLLSICNVPNSSLSRACPSCLFLNAGAEISVCSTKAFTSQIICLSLFALLLGKARSVINKEESILFLKELLCLPKKIELVLAGSAEIERLAKKHAHFKQFFFLGRGFMHVTALESALKLKEITYLNATGYPSGEMKHGPIALVDKDLLTIGLCSTGVTFEKILSNLMEVKARGGPLLIVAPEGKDTEAQVRSMSDDLLFLPRASEESGSILYAVALQLYAYYMAKEKGHDPDHPRNLAKSVTVE